MALEILSLKGFLRFYISVVWKSLLIIGLIILFYIYVDFSWLHVPFIILFVYFSRKLLKFIESKFTTYSY